MYLRITSPKSDMSDEVSRKYLLCQHMQPASLKFAMPLTRIQRRNAPFLMPHRNQKVIGPLRSWYVLVGFSQCGILHKLNASSKYYGGRTMNGNVPSLIDCDIIPPVIVCNWYNCCSRTTMILPPKIASTDLLPVLITRTRFLLSWTSNPVAKEEP